MRILSKNVVAIHRPGRAPLMNFITYVHPDKPILLRRTGWEVSNDVHDDHSDSISRDNGKTWSDPRPAIRSRRVDGGSIVHTEQVALYVPQRDVLIQWVNEKFEPHMEAGYDMDQTARIRITAGTPEAMTGENHPAPQILDFGIRQGLYVSFAHALLDSRQRVLVPVMWQMRACTPPTKPLRTTDRIGARGFVTRKDMPDIFSDVWEVGLMIGEFGGDGKIKWRVGKAVPFDLDKSSRGLCEGTIAELSGGRLAMIVRGSNEGWPDRAGYKWLSFSDDGGETWSKVVPLTGDDESPIESSSTGSALFRSRKNGKLYWIGNLCLEGRRPDGNMPRSPLYIAQIQEDPFAIKRDTVTAIDRAQPGEHPDTQHSNFRFYQDRETGELILFMTRYGERGYDDGRWINADMYEYRVQMHA